MLVARQRPASAATASLVGILSSLFCTPDPSHGAFLAAARNGTPAFTVPGQSMSTDVPTCNDTKTSSSQPTAIADPLLPTMIVFDLDDCLWSPEMHELPSDPCIPVEGDLDPDNPGRERGVVGMRCRGGWGETVSLFDGARKALRELATNPKFEGVVLAAASSSLEPSFSHMCLEGIEIVKGLTMRDMMRYDQIGRTGQLTPRKTTHFRLLQKESGVPYQEMLFFDDCNWGDHCADVTDTFGVVSQRTPRGLQLEEFHAGLDKYRRVATERRDR